ncbi:MAG: hypothetical protein ACOH2G_12175 [Ewingella sp.]
MKTLLIYGATGYTGRMIAKQAKDAGLNVVMPAEIKKNWMNWRKH